MAYLLIQAVTHFAPPAPGYCRLFKLGRGMWRRHTCYLLLVTTHPIQAAGLQGKLRGNEDLFYNKDIWQKNRHLKQVIKRYNYPCRKENNNNHMNNGLKNFKHSHESSVAMKCCQCKACCLSGILLDFKSIAQIAFYHSTEQRFSKKAPTYNIWEVGFYRFRGTP